MRLRALAFLVLLSLPACSNVLGFDDVQFSPAQGGSSDAAAAESSVEDGSRDVSPEDAIPDVPLADSALDAVDSPASPCDGVGCSGLGECVVADGGASCVCQPGYHAEGLGCVADETCSGVDCGRCGQCKVIGGKATCECPQGFVFDGTACRLEPDPCSPNPCDSEHVCVPEAHCQPLGACVPSCDCSNCGNCGPDNSDGRWNDWQEYCGNPNASPATAACNKPCPPGDGCIPYNPPLCWPMEGCFSL